VSASTDEARRPATMRDVAARAGVSVMTVSYAFNRPERVADRTRRRVLDAAAEVGFTHADPTARSLRTGRYGVLGVILGEHLTYGFEDPQAASFLAGVAETCAAHGLGMTIMPVGGDLGAGVIARLQVDGIIAWTLADDDPVIASLREVPVPVIMQSGNPGVGVAGIAIDDERSAAAIGAHMLRSARRPAVLSLPRTHARTEEVVLGPDPASCTFPVTRHRLRGLREAAADVGLDWSRVPVAFMERNSAQRSRGMAERLLAEHSPDVILCMGDQSALTVSALVAETAAAATAAGVTAGAHVRVSGWDADPVAVASGIPTVRQDLRGQGALAARWVLDPEQDHAVTFLEAPWELVV